MEIVIAAVVLAAGLVAGASLLSRRAPALAGSRTSGKPRPAAPARARRGGTRTDADLKERRTEMVRLEERLLSKEAALDQQRASLATREEAVEASTGRDRRPARAPRARARARRRA